MDYLKIFLIFVAVWHMGDANEQEIAKFKRAQGKLYALNENTLLIKDFFYNFTGKINIPINIKLVFD